MSESKYNGICNVRQSKPTHDEAVQSKLCGCVTVRTHVVGNQNLIPNVSTAFVKEQVVMLGQILQNQAAGARRFLDGETSGNNKLNL